MDQVNEGSVYELTVDFVDADGLAVPITAGTYRIDDNNSGIPIIASTPIDAVGESSAVIIITGEQNCILDDSLVGERRTVTVTYDFQELDEHGAQQTRQQTGAHIYEVMNLAFLSGTGDRGVAVDSVTVVKS